MEKIINNKKFNFRNDILVVSDVDGCITTGQFIYTTDGKVAKIFSANDHDGIKLLREYGIETIFVTADTTGFDITYSRTYKEMNCETLNINTEQRIIFIKEALKKYKKVIYFGDGPNDVKVKKECPEVIFITPKNGRDKCKLEADFVTHNKGGENAFVDLAEYIIEKYSYFILISH